MRARGGNEIAVENGRKKNKTSGTRLRATFGRRTDERSWFRKVAQKVRFGWTAAREWRARTTPQHPSRRWLATAFFPSSVEENDRYDSRACASVTENPNVWQTLKTHDSSDFSIRSISLGTFTSTIDHRCNSSRIITPQAFFHDVLVFFFCPPTHLFTKRPSKVPYIKYRSTTNITRTVRYTNIPRSFFDFQFFHKFGNDYGKRISKHSTVIRQRCLLLNFDKLTN